MGESFAPDCWILEHGAVVHYSATPEIALPVEAEGILLFDSGGQYLHGTTDITRTVALGKTSGQTKKRFYTCFKRNDCLVKGSISCWNQRFSSGCSCPESLMGKRFELWSRNRPWSRSLFECSRRTGFHPSGI